MPLPSIHCLLKSNCVPKRQACGSSPGHSSEGSPRCTSRHSLERLTFASGACLSNIKTFFLERHLSHVKIFFSRTRMLWQGSLVTFEDFFSRVVLIKHDHPSSGPTFCCKDLYVMYRDTYEGCICLQNNLLLKDSTFSSGSHLSCSSTLLIDVFVFITTSSEGLIFFCRTC